MVDRMPTDPEGYLLNLADWNTEVAELTATEAGISLTSDHWEIITLLRAFHATSDVVPAMRPLVTLVRRQLGTDKGNSLHLLRLFPNSPAKLAAKIAGLPRPTHCL